MKTKTPTMESDIHGEDFYNPKLGEKVVSEKDFVSDKTRVHKPNDYRNFLIKWVLKFWSKLF